jgi:hypothetical protein
VNLVLVPTVTESTTKNGAVFAVCACLSFVVFFNMILAIECRSPLGHKRFCASWLSLLTVSVLLRLLLWL